MKFADIGQSAEVFLDANVFIYHFGQEPTAGQACTELLERVERGELGAWTSTHVLAEVSHRLMTTEAIALLGWSHQGIAARLRRNPQHIQQLSRFRDALREILSLSLKTLTAQSIDILEAAEISRQHGILTNDAVIVSLMRRHGLANLASSDSDFDRVPGVVRYAPV